MPYTPSASANTAYTNLTSYFTALGFAAGLPADPNRIKALVDAVLSVASGTHALSTANTWTAGTGASQYSFPACPNATGVTISGGDEAGSIAFTSGASTTSGNVFTIKFATVYATAPTVDFTPTNANAAHLMYGNEWQSVTTTSGASLYVPTAAIGNLAFSFGWIGKGWA